MGIITLLTDFGVADEYVGVVKGVILNINDQARVIDISHQIKPQCVDQASGMLRAAYAWFPEGTIHTVVVDPGVGGDRAALAVRQAGYTFVAPDNGVLSAIWEDADPDMVVAVEKEDLFLHPVSHTFHGRDVFAPVAAHLSLGMDIRTLGPILTMDQVVRLDPPKPQWRHGQGLVGQVVGADRFGNILTNIDAQSIERFVGGLRNPNIVCAIADHRISGLSRTYDGHDKGRLIALIGSRDRLEIAVNQGDARKKVASDPGMPVIVSASHRAD